jgi:maltose-binding protein MalE
MIAAGVVAPIEGGLVLRSAEDYFPAALQTLQRKGVTLGLPTRFETVALYYNRDLAADQLPVETADLLALAQSAPALGTGLYANLYHVWWGFPAYSAQLFDSEGRVILDQNSGAAEFLTWMKALSDTPGSFVDDDYGMLLDRFKKGEFAFFVDGPWAFADLRAALGDALAAMPLPAGPLGPAQPWLNTDGLFVNPSLPPDQQMLALHVAEELTGPQAASRFTEIAGWLSANREAVPPDDPVLRGFMEQAATAQPAPTNPEMEQVWGYAGDMLIKVLADVSEPGAAVSETSALINEANGR